MSSLSAFFGDVDNRSLVSLLRKPAPDRNPSGFLRHVFRTRGQGAYAWGHSDPQGLGSDDAGIWRRSRIPCHGYVNPTVLGLP